MRAHTDTMAPTDRVPEHFIDRTPEYEDFIAKLREFHTNRGTRFDPEPKINATHVDLYKLFNCVVEHGGYDKVSEKKLTWREILSKLGIYSHNPAAASFTLKTLYYKNLAAYEIRTVYNKTPPPPEILEDLSARGSGILTRTLEGFTPKNRRSSTAQNSPQPSGDDGTPARDSKPEDTPSSGRAARGLRQAPPQRVIFQPDTGPTRPSRHASSQHQSNAGTPNASQQSHGHPSASSQSNGHPQAHNAGRPVTHQMNHAPPGQIPQPHTARGGASASYNPQSYEYQSSTVQSFQPPANVPLPLRPVETPSNAPAKFARAKYPPGYAPLTQTRQAPLPGSKLLFSWGSSVLVLNSHPQACRLRPRLSTARIFTHVACTPFALAYQRSRLLPCTTCSRSRSSVATGTSSKGFQAWRKVSLRSH